MTTATLTPIERLNSSRARLRHAMSRPESKDGNAATSGNKSVGLGVLEVLKLAIPSASLVIDALAQWWSGHPLQASSNLAEGVADQILRPLAKRHPIALVLGAASLGALLIFTRPWRWALRPQLMTTMGPVLLSSALASGTLQSWLQNLLAKATAPIPEPAAASPQNPTPSNKQSG